MYKTLTQRISKLKHHSRKYKLMALKSLYIANKPITRPLTKLKRHATFYQPKT